MSLELTELMAYVDGDLSADRRRVVEHVAETDSETADALRRLQASRLPYQSAFAAEPLPDMPRSLERTVDHLVRVATASRALATAGPAAVPTGQHHLAPWMLIVVSLAVTIAIAITPLLVGRSTPVEPLAPWLQRAASYHTMYARETVIDGQGGLDQAAALQRRLKDAHGLRLAIPDFSAKGLQFVRAQQLQFEGRMVLQLVYLPETGLPIALCLTPGLSGKERQLTVDGLAAVVWHMNGWDYALIGDTQKDTLRALRAIVKDPLV